MKSLKSLFYLSIFLIFNSCGKDIGTVTVSYQEANAIYGDISEIRSTPLNVSSKQIVNPGKIFITEQYILLGEEEQGIHVIDNTDLNNPIPVSFINIPGNREFIVKDEFIYAESYYDMLKIDISDISNPVLANRALNVFSEELINEQGETLIGFSFTEVTKELDQNSQVLEEISSGNQLFLDYAKRVIPKSALPSSFAGSGNSNFGAANRIALNQDHVYIISRNQLHILENGSFEKTTNNVNFAFANEMETVFPYQNKLFIGTRSSMDIIDITDPANPGFDYRFDHATSCDPVLPVNGAAYITLRTAEFSPCPGNVNALIVLDINNLETPREIDEINMVSPYGMTMINNMLFVAEGENGLKIFDASNPLALILLSKITGVQAYDIIAHPTLEDALLLAGPDGLSQYHLNQDFSLDLESHISF